MSDLNYIPGEVARVSVAVTNAAGAAVDPGALRLKVKSPSAVLVTHTYGGSAVVVKDATGLYHADIDLPTAGIWVYRWELDAPNAGAAEGAITVQKSRVI